MLVFVLGRKMRLSSERAPGPEKTTIQERLNRVSCRKAVVCALKSRFPIDDNP